MAGGGGEWIVCEWEGRWVCGLSAGVWGDDGAGAAAEGLEGPLCESCYTMVRVIHWEDYMGWMDELCAPSTISRATQECGQASMPSSLHPFSSSVGDISSAVLIVRSWPSFPEE
jgi:hypothetical protein